MDFPFVIVKMTIYYYTAKVMTTNVQDSYTHMYISCINSLLGLRVVEVADLHQRGEAEVLKGCCIHAALGQTGENPLSHRNPEHLCGRPIEQQRTASPSGWGELRVIAGG